MPATIAFDGLTKQYGSVTALDRLTAQVQPGRITAFLGANGSGKTTSMRVLLGLTDPTAGAATIDGHAYRSLEHPMRRVGAVLDQGFHPNRNARNHLRILAAQAAVPRTRVEEVLDLVGLTRSAGRRVAGYSLGMRQRLALASALIAEPETLVLDEPFNGLDPDGIQTMRHLLRRFADQGGTVFLSSHLLAEVAHSADDAIIINAGHLVSQGPLSTLGPAARAVAVTTPDADLLLGVLHRRGATVTKESPERIRVVDLERAVIGRAALEAGAVILDMRAEGDDLESIFQDLIHPTEGACTS